MICIELKSILGGPVFVKKAANDFVQIGLVSWGPDPSNQQATTWDINADVGYYLQWITENMNAYVFKFQFKI